MTPAHELSRLRWRCRRGLKELDVLLERYLSRRWPGAPAPERAAFRRLLELSDPELKALCLAGAPAAEPALADLVRELTAQGPGDAPA